MSRVPFSIALADLVGAFDSSHGSVRADEVAVDLPIEVDVGMSDDELVFYAHPRRWRWVTDFDERPGRLRVRYTTRSGT